MCDYLIICFSNYFGNHFGPHGTSGWSRQDTARSNAIGGVRRAAASALEGTRTESWSYKTARTADKQKCFERKLHRKEFATT